MADNFTFSINEYKELVSSLKTLLVSGDIKLNSLSDLEDIDNIDEIRANNKKLYTEYLKALTIFIKTLKITGDKRYINLAKEDSKKQFLNFIKELMEDSNFSALDKDLTKETLYISFKLFDNYSNHEMDIINHGIEKALMLPNNSINKLGYGGCTKSFYNVISSGLLI